MMTHVDGDGSPPQDRAASPTASGGESVLSIELCTTASVIAIPTIRTVAADLAARADFDLDSIDDLRMAVDDVCAMLVRIAALNARLRCSFTVRAERIELAAEVDADDSAVPLPTRSFGWRVLESLADDVSACYLPAAPGCGGQGAGAYGQDRRVRITLAKDAVAKP